ncbi:chemotaxis protein CheD [Celeribacter arenosi]|uniref:Probable chemoreceptor glutamine deamidase CheD n=1 Tax=Celeribacter arenosi TaxID=792649 RepID=A0ABP7KH90_9RHOB
MNQIFKMRSSCPSTYIAQGEFAISAEPGAVISTILGSCVATCLWDPVMALGGMNHILLPGEPSANSDASYFGAAAMEQLINALIREGADKSRLRAKVFGGAEMYRGLTKAGNLNGVFVLDYLGRERITCEAQSIGGSLARRVEFFPQSGAARQRFVEDTHIPEIRPAKVETNDIELL